MSGSGNSLGDTTMSPVLLAERTRDKVCHKVMSNKISNRSGRHVVRVWVYNAGTLAEG